jgi:cysteinyl-tRNA synthetase
MLSLYNTLTRKKEKFSPLQPPNVTFYQCGPTVYWTQHIGNMRAVVMSDLIRRSLEYLNYKVTFVRNYTDVGHLTSDADEGEDKMEKAVKREKITPDEIAQKYIDIFEKDIKLLNTIPPNHSPRATQYIKKMIEMIETLIKNNHAYITPLAIYFDISTYSNYTKLSRQKLEKQSSGKGKANVDDPQKKHPSDFALWFFKAGSHKNALQTWDSPWGRGFPGWHIECSVMSKSLLGNSLDIHMGGVEHISVHHTNEIAQSVCANRVPFVNYWLHNEHLTVNGKKMAKSEGTGYALSELIEKGYDPLSLRYFFLNAHYRSKQDFTWETLSSAERSLKSLRQFAIALRKNPSRQSLSEEKNEKLINFQQKFIAALEDDINISSALGTLWEMLKSNIPSEDKYETLLEWDRVFGLKLTEWEEEIVPESILSIIQKRNEARKNNDFAESDKLRNDALKLGYILEDTTSGTIAKK